MAIPELTEDVKIIQALSTYPNWEDGLTEEQMKQKFDAAAVIIKNYLNGTLVPAVQLLQRALNNGDIIAVDDTLTTAGCAAEAKTTGDRLKALENPAAPLPIERGGTGAATAANVLKNLGLTVSAEELNFMTGVTGNVQEHLKFMTGVTGNVQEQLNNLSRWAKPVNNTDMNTVKTTGFYYGYTGMTNAATNYISIWEVIAYSGDWGVQKQTVIHENGTGKTFERRWYGGNNWTTWKAVLDSESWSDYISVSGGGTTAVGMGREFSVANNAGSYKTTGKQSKFYIITLSVGGKIHSLTVDYQSVNAVSGKTKDFSIPDSQYTLRATINSDGTVTFDLGTAGKIEHISGYY